MPLRTLAPAEKANPVLTGLDGWLFLVGGTNKPARMQTASLSRWWRIRRWSALIKRRHARARSLGIAYRHVVAPEKLSVYPEMTGDERFGAKRGYAHQLGRTLSAADGYVDLLPALMQAKAGSDIYYKSDSHWNQQGCQAAHDAICHATGAAIRWQLDDRPGTVHRWVGDLGTKVAKPPVEMVLHREVTVDAVRIWTNALLADYERVGEEHLLHRGAAVRFKNAAPNADQRRALLFGDSFSHFGPMLLTAMLAETFRELQFVWSAAIDWDLVARERPDLVITQISERFMRKIPSDDFDSDAFAARELARRASQVVERKSAKLRLSITE